MSFCLTGEILDQCSDLGSGGMERFYLAPRDAVTSVTTDADGIVTAITMSVTPTGYFYEFEGYQETMSFTETLTGEVPNTSYEQVLNAIFRLRSQAKRNTIEELRACACGLVVIHTEMTGKRWIWGLNSAQGGSTGFAAKLTANEGTTGLALGDQNQESITLTAKATAKAIELDAGVTIALAP